MKGGLQGQMRSMMAAFFVDPYLLRVLLQKSEQNLLSEGFLREIWQDYAEEKTIPTEKTVGDFFNQLAKTADKQVEEFAILSGLERKYSNKNFQKLTWKLQYEGKEKTLPEWAICDLVRKLKNQSMNSLIFRIPGNTIDESVAFEPKGAIQSFSG
jgi:hypothetical protein